MIIRCCLEALRTPHRPVAEEHRDDICKFVVHLCHVPPPPPSILDSLWYDTVGYLWSEYIYLYLFIYMQHSSMHDMQNVTGDISLASSREYICT